MDQGDIYTIAESQVRDDNFIDMVEADSSDDVQIIGVVEGTTNDQSSSVEFIRERRLPELIQRRARGGGGVSALRRSRRNARAARDDRGTRAVRTRRRREREGRQGSRSDLFGSFNLIMQLYDNESGRFLRGNNFTSMDDEEDWFSDLVEYEPEDDINYGEDYEEAWSLIDRLGDVKPKGLPKSSLDALPHRSFNLNGRLETPACTICLNTYEQGDDLVHLECDHYFHKRCARRWLKKNATCPVCRQRVVTVINLVK
jgi:RING finger family protein